MGHISAENLKDALFGIGEKLIQKGQLILSTTKITKTDYFENHSTNSSHHCMMM
jgi:hypothetical protein